MYKTLVGPLTAQIEITGNCNNKCVHCYNFWRESQEKQHSLSVDQIKSIFQKLSDAKVFDVTITGGEPLLNKQGLLMCFQEANRLNLGINLNSNLVPLNPAYLKELQQVGLKSVLTSILGPTAEIHDGITQRKGSFDKLIKNIKLCLNENTRVTANMVISKKNIKFIKKTAELVASLGIKTFTATRASCPGNCNDFSDLRLSITQFRNYLKSLHQAGIDLGVNIGVLESYPFCGIKDLKQYENFTDKRCTAGITTFTVGSDGNIRPCSHANMSYGNIFTEETSSIWSKMDEWRNGSFIPEKCKKCEIFSACGGGCRMDGKMANKNRLLNNMDPHSSIKDIQHCASLIKAQQRKNIGTISDDIKNFVLSEKLKSREEKHGMIIWKGGKMLAFLSESGAKIFAQFKLGESYKINDEKINWGNIDSHDFIVNLKKKEVIFSISEERR